MALQILPNLEAQKGQLEHQARLQGVGQALQGLGNYYQQQQKQRQYQETLQNLENEYAGNPEQQRLIKAYRSLGGQFPEQAQQLAGHLSRLDVQRQKSVADQLKGQQLAQGMQNIQNIYADPDLNEDQKIFAVYQELSQNPSLAHNLIGSLQQQKKAQGEGVAGEQFAKGYRAILEDDKESLRDILEDPSTPLPVKKQLTDLEDRAQTRKSVQARELRNRQSLVQRSYKQAIEAERKRLDLASSKEIPAINKRIKKLETLQRHDLKRLAKNPESYTSLSLWNAVDPDYLPEEEEEGLEGAELAGEELGGELGGMEFAGTERAPEMKQSPDIEQRINALNQQFPPAQFRGKRKRDNQGNIFESDGRIWRLVQE